MNMPALGSGPVYPVASTPGLFDEVELGPLRLSTRFAVAPVTRVSATTDACASACVGRYDGDFARAASA